MALAGSPGSKAMKQVSQQISIFAVKMAGESMQTSMNCLSLVLWCKFRKTEFEDGLIESLIKEKKMGL